MTAKMIKSERRPIKKKPKYFIKMDCCKYCLSGEK